MAPMPPAAPPRPDGAPPDRRADSMLLLSNLVEDSLDEGYARAAARKAARTAAGDPAGHGGAVLLTVGLLMVGLLLATAFEQTRERAGSAADARQALVEEVQARSEANDRAQARLERQRAAVARDQRDALELTGAGSALSDRLARLEDATGAAPVTGPGMVVRVDDAAAEDQSGADDDPRTDGADEGRVTDRDLQTVVNEVWAAGAEAVAVNGQRLTALSAIRAAGDAVLVDFRPLNPPYDIRAVGDPDRLRKTFVSGFGGSYLQVLQGYGITYSVTDRDRLQLPASAGVRLRYAATPERAGRPSASPTGGPR
jgi:uncharacterized protein YlxW (UPF0749 family)